MTTLTRKMFIFLLIGILFPALCYSEENPDKKVNVKIAPDEVRTFTKSDTLPGGISVEFSLVTLQKYSKDVDAVFKYTFSETERIARLFNSADTNSDLGQIEASAGKSPVTVSKETMVLAEQAKKIADWTTGAFDPVRGPGTYKNLKIDKKNSTIFLTKPGLSLDLRGILEGFMADLFIRAAHYSNLDDAFVSVNGVARSMGHASYGPWQTTVATSGDKSAKSGMSISIANYSAATVGNDHYTPTVDPRKNTPVDSDFYSVTVLTKEAATAQGVASSIYVMGTKPGKGLIDALGVRAIFAYRDGKIEKIGKW